MHDFLGTCAIEVLGGSLELLFSLGNIALVDCRQNFFNLGFDRGFDRLVPRLTNFILAETLFSTFAVWHWICQNGGVRLRATKARRVDFLQIRIKKYGDLRLICLAAILGPIGIFPWETVV